MTTMENLMHKLIAKITKLEARLDQVKDLELRLKLDEDRITDLENDYQILKAVWFEKISKL